MKIGLLGAGHLGKIHIKCLRLVPQFELVGFYDSNESTRQTVAADFDLKAFSDPEQLMDACDAVDIVTPTPTHFELASKAIQKGKHVFIEKPVTENTEQAQALLDLQKKHKVKVQIGHVERFNPAYIALREVELKPMFIEGHRLATFNPRGTDVSVILDLMIHDLDLVLQLIPSKVKEIRASSVSVVSPTADICNARLEFENGAVANLTASRISMKQMRKIRMFQPDAYVSVDLLEKEAQIIKLADEPSSRDDIIEMPLETPKGTKTVQIMAPQVEPNNAIQSELSSFYNSIANNEETIVTLAQGSSALLLARRIMEISEENKV